MWSNNRYNMYFFSTREDLKIIYIKILWEPAWTVSETWKVSGKCIYPILQLLRAESHFESQASMRDLPTNATHTLFLIFFYIYFLHHDIPATDNNRLCSQLEHVSIDFLYNIFCFATLSLTVLLHKRSRLVSVCIERTLPCCAAAEFFSRFKALEMSNNIDNNRKKSSSEKKTVQKINKCRRVWHFI